MIILQSFYSIFYGNAMCFLVCYKVGRKEWEQIMRKDRTTYKTKTGRRQTAIRIGAAALLCAAAVSVTGCGADRTDEALAYRKIGLNEMEKGNYAQAVDSFQQALDQSGGQIRNLELDICMNKAEALYRNGQTADAIAVCDAVLNYDDGYADAYYLRGNLYLQQGDTAHALSDYEQAAAHAKADYEVYIQLYQNLVRAGRTQDGITYLDMALEIKAKDRVQMAERGYVYFLKGDYASAKEQLRQAVEAEKKEGTDDRAELYLAQTLEQLGEEDEAAKYYRLYAQDHEDDSIVLEELGNMAMEKQDYADAYDYYEKGLKTSAPSNEQLLRRGKIAALEQLYEFAQAKEEMAQYVLDYPEDEQAAREYLFLKTRTAVDDQIREEQAQAAENVTENSGS